MPDYPTRDGLGNVIIEGPTPPGFQPKFATPADVADLAGRTPMYISADRMHVADVLANFPASAERRGMLARVDDLYGLMDGSLICGFDGTRYFWRPNGLPEAPATAVMAITSGDITLTALGSPTIVPVSGTIAALTTRKIILSLEGVYPGARKRITTYGVGSILGTLQLVSGVTNLLSLALGGTYDVAVDYVGGSPQWARI